MLFVTFNFLCKYIFDTGWYRPMGNKAPKPNFGNAIFCVPHAWCENAKCQKNGYLETLSHGKKWTSSYPCWQGEKSTSITTGQEWKCKLAAITPTSGSCDRVRTPLKRQEVKIWKLISFVMLIYVSLIYKYVSRTMYILSSTKSSIRAVNSINHGPFSHHVFSYW